MQLRSIILKKKIIILVVSFLVFIPAILLEYPTVYPTGTTIYKPDKCWNGFTIIDPSYNYRHPGVYIIDMNGNIIKMWKGLHGHPVRLLPGGHAIGIYGERGIDNIPVQVDWNDEVIWKAPEGIFANHDVQRDGNPVGYYVPGMKPEVLSGNTLINSHRGLVSKSNILPRPLLGNYFTEVTWKGQIVWEWSLNDHFDELGLSEAAKNAIYRWGHIKDRIDAHPGQNADGDMGADWAHVNSMAYLGLNKWYDSGDERFHPNNIIFDCREIGAVYIISKKTGEVVWHVGPDWESTMALRRLGPFIGQHHAHMVPKGLPGEGNILVFDNGGEAGYGSPNPGAPYGVMYYKRGYSRVVEFDPITLEIIWEYNAENAGYGRSFYNRFFSWYVGSAQRLPNGNTLITEGCHGRIFEVTSEKEIVWEYIHPFTAYRRDEGIKEKMEDYRYVFRAFRYPYEWLPQVKRPIEKTVIPPELSEFKINPKENK
jgi:outer membrane protein assembly factor BamB